MKQFKLSIFFTLLMSMVGTTAQAYTEYETDFTIETSEYSMSFVIGSNNTVSLDGGGEYDDGDRYYYCAVEPSYFDPPYNLVIPQTVSYGTTSYSVISIANGAFGNGARKSDDRVTVHYEDMTRASSIYSLTLPSTIQTINSMLPSIKILKCCASTPPTLNMNIPSTCSVIYVPAASLSQYQSATGWSKYANRMIGYSTNSNLISNISLSSKSYEINDVSTMQLTPTLTPTSSASNLTWSSSNTSVATVNASGLVSGVSPGTCYITATSSDGGYVFSTVQFTVTATPPITGIALNKTKETLYLGSSLDSKILTATITPSECTNVGVTWSSSDPNIATVNQNGRVTAVSEGITTITCVANDDSGISASCQITVKSLSLIRIGTGTNSTNTAPFHSTNKHNEVFIKYNSNEIGKVGKIQGITFYENWGYGSINNISVEIWMGTISNSSFYNSTSPTGNEMLSQMTRVYEKQITIDPNNNASTSLKRQRSITLDTPFEYDGVSDLNIFIATSFQSIPSNTLKYDYTSTSNYSVKYRGFDDSVTPSSWTWTNSKNRPNIQLWLDEEINNINNSDFTISPIAAVTYNGSAQTPAVTLMKGTTTLTSGTDYTVSYSNNTNAGTATVTITGMGNYTGTKTANFTINPKNASNLTISSIAAVTYNGSAQTPTVTVKDGITTLTSGTDYTVSYSNNTNAGTATVTITGMGNYTGTKTANFTINPKNASNLTINSIAAVTYNGSAQTPTVTVKDGTTTLTNGTDYTVSYSNNTNAGTATMTVTGKGNYTGTKTATFTINPKNASYLTISSIAAATYNGFAQTPAVTVKDGTTTLTSGTDYTVSYSNNTNVGTATVTITGMGNYTGTKTASFTILLDEVSITVNSLGKGTYCSEYPLDFTNVSGIEAYIVSGFKPSAGNLIVTRAYEVPAGTGLYIVGTPGNTYNIPIESTDFYYSNMMKGVLVQTIIPANEGGYTNYVLSSDGHGGVIFKLSNNASSPANRAYVQIPSSMAGARKFLGIETDDGSTTGLNGVFTSDAKEAEGDYYNLNGQKVQTPQKGLYIKNGKKIIIH